MNPTDPSTLPLRDIHLPAAVSWFPPAPGWWLLAGFGLIALLALAWWWKRYRPDAIERASLAMLDQLRSDFEQQHDIHRLARGLSTLGRQLTVSASRPEMIAQTGREWIDNLAEIGGLPWPDDLLDLLRRAPYSAELAATFDTTACQQAIEIFQQWIRFQGRQRRRFGHA